MNTDKVRLGLGVTGKIREANIKVSSGTASADFPDVGFVPLVNFYFSYAPVEKFGFLAEADALGIKQGRAEDIFAGVTYAVSDHVAVKAGYRVLEGGADVARNYNFSWINYAVAGVLINLK